MVNDYRRLWTDVAKKDREAEAVQILTEILTDKEGRAFISNLGGGDAKLCIEILDRGIAKHNLEVAQKQRFFTALRRLAASHGRLPESMIIAENIEVEDDILASGGFADVRRGSYGGYCVAVRTLRVTLEDDVYKIRKRFCEEVVLWNTLSHPNVLKLAGVQGDMKKGRFITISEWMKHGNIMEYIKHNHVNRLELLYGAAQGLEYLHGANLIHGDIKGANILMSNDMPPRACLADFGFMKMVLDPDNPMSCGSQLDGGTLVFMSPEILQPQKFNMKTSRPTTQPDVYAFGLVIFQVLTGEIPFRGSGPAGPIFSIVEGLRPEKPNDAPAIGFSDPLWAFTQRCWDANMESRPEVPEVVAHLSWATANWDGVMEPHVRAECVDTNPGELISDSEKHWGLFKQLRDVTLKNAPRSRVPSAIFSNTDPASTQFTEPISELQFATPELKPWSPVGPNEEPHYPHLSQNYPPPPSLLPKRKWTSFRSLKRKFLKFFGLQRGD